MTPPRKLLVLDLDETLIHAREDALERAADFRVGPYHVYRRPHLDAFVAEVLQHFDVAVWTASGGVYAAQVVAQIFPTGSLKFVWSSRRCTRTRNWMTGEYTTAKKLAKLKRHGFALESIIAVDDTPSKYANSYGNLVTVREFEGDLADDELPALAAYLKTLLPHPNVRRIEKRFWRQRGDGLAEARAEG